MIKWDAKEKNFERVKRFVNVYANMLNNGSIDWNKLGKIYNTKEKLPEVKARRLLRVKEISEMVTERLIELTEKHGITAKESLEYRKQALQMAIDKGDLTNLNKALDSFDIKLDLQPIKQISSTVTTSDYIKMIDKSKGSIEAKQVKQIETGSDEQK